MQDLFEEDDKEDDIEEDDIPYVEPSNQGTANTCDQTSAKSALSFTNQNCARPNNSGGSQSNNFYNQNNTGLYNGMCNQNTTSSYNSMCNQNNASSYNAMCNQNSTGSYNSHNFNNNMGFINNNNNQNMNPNFYNTNENSQDMNSNSYMGYQQQSYSYVSDLNNVHNICSNNSQSSAGFCTQNTQVCSQPRSVKSECQMSNSGDFKIPFPKPRAGSTSHNLQPKQTTENLE